MIKVFVGYDPSEVVAFHTLVQSILDRSTVPVSFLPVNLTNLKGSFDRPKDPKQSTEFAFSRFLVPWLCKYNGWALFLDCDFLFQEDIQELWNMRDDTFAVQVVKHDYVPSGKTKFLNKAQSQYTMKNWSSLMLFNCHRCKTLTPEYVTNASGLELHQFRWLQTQDLIGSLPAEWNHLVGEYSPNPNAKAVHFTLGGPWFQEYSQCEFSDEWRRTFSASTANH